jgi:hypothetical protein
MFAPVVRELRIRGADATILSLDRLYEQGASATAHSLDIPAVEAEVARASSPPGQFYRRSPLRVWRDVLKAKPGFSRTLKRLRPTAVVVGSDNGPVEHLIVHLSQRARIGTALVQDGRLGDRAPQRASTKDRIYQVAKRLISPPLGWVGFPYLGAAEYGTTGVDLVCATGPDSASLLARRAGSRSRVIVTGQPRYDRLVTLLSRRQALRKDAPLIMFTTPFAQAGLGEAAQRAQEALVVDLATAMHRGGVPFLAKPHPREDEARYRELVGTDAVAPIDADPATLLVDALAAVVGISTLIEEACILGCPVLIPGSVVHESRFGVLLPPSGTFPRFESGTEAATIIRGLGGINRAHMVAAQSEAATRWVSFSVDRPATGAVADALIELGTTHRSNPVRRA